MPDYLYWYFPLMSFMWVVVLLLELLGRKRPWNIIMNLCVFLYFPVTQFILLLIKWDGK